jgi:class 3 adenylate cyclase
MPAGHGSGRGCGRERKQVTVLFADVVSSMKLAATLDPERLREIMYELFNRAAAVVQRYEGMVNQFTGDGLMALFGAPAALEDHALRACISALEIQPVVRGLAADVLARDSMDLQIRIGLNSGEVIAGKIGAGSYTAVGHPVGMAQRMEAAAEPGGIVCSASTARLVERSAVLGPIAWITVKGPPNRLRRNDSNESSPIGRCWAATSYTRRNPWGTVADRECRRNWAVTLAIGEPVDLDDEVECTKGHHLLTDGGGKRRNASSLRKPRCPDLDDSVAGRSAPGAPPLSSATDIAAADLIVAANSRPFSAS